VSDRKQLTKFELASLLFESRDRMPRHLYDSNGQQYFGTIETVQREDNSGSSFNVTIQGQRGTTTIFLRTID
jgi:hypothetical protein